MAIQFIDLCSGIGGFHSGLMATGHYECVGHAEIQGYKTEILTPTHKDWNEDLIISQKDGEPQWTTQLS